MHKGGIQHSILAYNNFKFELYIDMHTSLYTIYIGCAVPAVLCRKCS